MAKTESAIGFERQQEMKTILEDLNLGKREKEIVRFVKTYWASENEFVKEALTFFGDATFSDPYDMGEQLNDERILSNAWRDPKDEWKKDIWVKNKELEDWHVASKYLETCCPIPSELFSQVGLGLPRNRVLTRIASERNQEPKDLAREAVLYFAECLKDSDNFKSVLQ